MRVPAWSDTYLHEVRFGFDQGRGDPAFFLTSIGEAFTANRVTQLVRGRANAADLGRSGKRHLFRHGGATLMLVIRGKS